jgi:dynein assembly factor 3
MEQIARHMLLLHLCFDQTVPIKHRINRFLEVYGNFYLQARTIRELESICDELAASLSDQGSLSSTSSQRNPLHATFDLSLLKFKERDLLLSTFLTWRNECRDILAKITSDASATTSYLDMQALRDRRLRAYFEERYDYRQNLIDQDYEQKVRPVASIIHRKQYSAFREEGIAFEFGDQVYSEPNITLGSFVEGSLKQGKDRGRKKEVRGCWADILNPPFYGLGVHLCSPLPEKGQAWFGQDRQQQAAASTSLLQIVSRGTGVEQHRHHTVELCVFNLLNIIFAIELGEDYEMEQEHDLYSGIHRYGDEEEEEGGEEKEEEKSEKQERLSRLLNTLQISFIGAKTERHLQKTTSRFDITFLSSHSAMYRQWRNEAEEESKQGSKLFCPPTQTMLVESLRFNAQLSSNQDLATLDRTMEQLFSRLSFEKVGELNGYLRFEETWREEHPNLYFPPNSLHLYTWNG